MKILLTNDDGYKAPNIQSLFKKLSKEHDVWIIAPENNCSGMSAAISFLKETEIRQVEDRVFAVDGTPADCTYFGLLGIVDFEFDMVVSGINHGANIGTDVIYSGTVGAAVGGRKLKYPPLALSVASYETINIDFIVNKTIEIINLVASLPKEYVGKVINVNFPDLPEKECKGMKVTALEDYFLP
jgi:5'-nucleotidase